MNRLRYKRGFWRLCVALNSLSAALHIFILMWTADPISLVVAALSSVFAVYSLHKVDVYNRTITRIEEQE